MFVIETTALKEVRGMLYVAGKKKSGKFAVLLSGELQGPIGLAVSNNATRRRAYTRDPCDRRAACESANGIRDFEGG